MRIRESAGLQWGPLGEKKLRLDDVGGGDGLSDGVFDLEAWIDFEEVVGLGRGVDEELKGAEREVLYLPGISIPCPS